MQRKQSIRSFIARCCGWLLLLSLFNTLIDARDIRHYLVEPGSYNEMESIAEWFLEDVMDIDNAIPENDADDTEKKFQPFSSDWEDYFPAYVEAPGFRQSRLFYPFNHQHHPSPGSKVLTPPPDQFV